MQEDQRIKKVKEFIRMYLNKGEILKQDHNEVTVKYYNEASKDLVSKLLKTNYLQGSGGGRLVVIYGGYRIVLEFGGQDVNV